MQIRTTLIFYLTSDTVVRNKRTSEKENRSVVVVGNTQSLLVGVPTSVTSKVISVEIPHEGKRNLLPNPALPLLEIVSNYSMST